MSHKTRATHSFPKGYDQNPSYNRNNKRLSVDFQFAGPAHCQSMTRREMETDIMKSSTALSILSLSVSETNIFKANIRHL
ncbi:hypothetical protein ACLB1R_00900 [Escherichia coli]